MPISSFAAFKRAIQPGTRLRCIVNTFRPVLNGRERIVTRIQTNGFYWKDLTEHQLLIRSIRDADASCSCGGWAITFPTFDSDTETHTRERIEEDFVGHKHRATKDFWTAYGKASDFNFNDGRITMRLFDQHSLTLEIL